MEYVQLIFPKVSKPAYSTNAEVEHLQSAKEHIIAAKSRIYQDITSRQLEILLLRCAEIPIKLKMR